MTSKVFVWLGITAMVVLGNGKDSNATEPEVQIIKISDPTTEVYRKIDFAGADSLSYDVFAKAYAGYNNLKAEGKLSADKHILTVCDYSLSSTKNRMWVIDLAANKVLLNTYVAHGQGTGEEFARAFSNNDGSHQSSMGFYVTGDTYNGSHGNSLYLHGMDKGYNDAAYARSIVMHGAAYVSKDFIAGQGRLGRSWGCPAVSAELCDKVIDYTKGGTCLFIYYPEEQYLAESYWLNKKAMPEEQLPIMAATTAGATE